MSCPCYDARFITKMAIFLILVVVTVPTNVFAQTNNNDDSIKTENSEHLVVPFSDSANRDRRNPYEYNFNNPVSENWILTTQNDITYTNNPDSKLIIRLHEPEPSDKFIEIAMFSDQTKEFWAAVNTEESGYIRIYERETDGWSRDEPVVIAHANNSGLTITNGKRIIIDKLSVDGFTLGSLEIYGKDNVQSENNANAGNISFDLIYGSPSDSPLYYLPLGMLIGVGGLLLALLIFKKRKVYRET